MDVVKTLGNKLNAKQEDLRVLESSLVDRDGFLSRSSLERLNDHLGPIRREGTAGSGEWTFSSVITMII